MKTTIVDGSGILSSLGSEEANLSINGGCPFPISIKVLKLLISPVYFFFIFFSKLKVSSLLILRAPRARADSPKNRSCCISRYLYEGSLGESWRPSRIRKGRSQGNSWYCGLKREKDFKTGSRPRRSISRWQGEVNGLGWSSPKNVREIVRGVLDLWPSA